MSDLIDKQVVLDTIHLFFTEEIDKIPTKKTEEGEVLIMCKAQPLFEMNKTICKRIKALPSVSPTQNCVENALDMRCDDAISRQAVIDAIEDDNRNGHYSCFASNNDAQCFKDVIRSLPSVNPQEPKIDTLDKIRAEIEQTTSRYTISRERGAMGQVEWSDRLIKESEVLEILDKYKAGSDNCN